MGETDTSFNQNISEFVQKYPFEKTNREYAREILEIIRYLLQSLPFSFETNKTPKIQTNEYYLLQHIINNNQFSSKCIDLAQRLYNLRNHLFHWKRTKKQMSFKSICHYMNVSKQFIIELSKQQ